MGGKSAKSQSSGLRHHRLEIPPLSRFSLLSLLSLSFSTSTTATMPAPRTLFWRPTAQQAARSPDALFRLYINERYNLDLKDYFELHAFSINNLDDFWSAVYDYCGVIGERTYVATFFAPSLTWFRPSLVLTASLTAQRPQLPLRRLEADGGLQSSAHPGEDELRRGASFFSLEKSRLTRADPLPPSQNMLLSHEYRRSDHRALVSLIEPTGTSPAELDAAVMRSLSFEELYVEVGKVAHTLRSFGIKPGDRVATYSPSNAEAVILCLGALAVGAVWSSCPAEFGVKSTLERLEQIEPKVLLTADFYKYNGKKLSVFPNVRSSLPSLDPLAVLTTLRTAPRDSRQAPDGATCHRRRSTREEP